MNLFISLFFDSKFLCMLHYNQLIKGGFIMQKSYFDGGILTYILSYVISFLLLLLPLD